MAVVGCSTYSPSEEPLVDVSNRALAGKARVQAIDAARERVAADPGRTATTQRVLKDVAWTASEPTTVRMAAIGALLDDPSEAVRADAKEMVKLLLPRERSLAVVIYLSEVAKARRWTDAIPALIRSYSRSVESLGWTGGIRDADRPERDAIIALSEGRAIEEVVFGVFLKPPAVQDTLGADWEARLRSDAWDLLARLDRDGTQRRRMVGAVPPGEAEIVEQIRRCVRDLRAMPLTGDELRWLSRLLDAKKTGNAEWWSQAAAAIATLPPEVQLSMRHAEPVRWASVAHKEWLGASKEELLGVLRARLEKRRIWERNVEQARYRVRERLDHWAPTMEWADVLALLIADEVVHEPGVLKAITAQAELDRNDQTTEYGGAILRKNVGLGTIPREEWVAMLFPPRPGQRQGDERFVASDDMLNASDAALLHYHMHVQKERNEQYAGPSPGDLIYAARFGRSCVVFTSVGKGGRMNVDYYQPDGVVVDLGEVEPPAVEVDSGMRRGIGPR